MSLYNLIFKIFHFLWELLDAILYEEYIKMIITIVLRYILRDPDFNL